MIVGFTYTAGGSLEIWELGILSGPGIRLTKCIEAKENKLLKGWPTRQDAEKRRMQKTI